MPTFLIKNFWELPPTQPPITLPTFSWLWTRAAIDIFTLSLFFFILQNFTTSRIQIRLYEIWFIFLIMKHASTSMYRNLNELLFRGFSSSKSQEDLIVFSGPKGLNIVSAVEFSADFKNSFLTKIWWSVFSQFWILQNNFLKF